MGRGARSWEDSPGEQPRGGAGGRGRRGRGRGSPHLSGGGDAAAADRKSKVGAGRGWRPPPEALHCPSSLFLLSKGPLAQLSVLLCLSLAFRPSIRLFSLTSRTSACVDSPWLFPPAFLPPPPLPSLAGAVRVSVSVGLCVSAFSVRCMSLPSLVCLTPCICSWGAVRFFFFSLDFLKIYF